MAVSDGDVFNCRIFEAFLLSEIMNKCLNVIGILLVLLLFPYCGRRDARQMDGQGSGAHAALAEIDSLMWRQPDSALTVLQEFASSAASDSLDEFNGHYCQLLIS